MADEEQLAPHRELSLDDAIESLRDDELLEATPKSLRIRKAELRHHVREKSVRQQKYS